MDKLEYSYVRIRSYCIGSWGHAFSLTRPHTPLSGRRVALAKQNNYQQPQEYFLSNY